MKYVFTSMIALMTSFATLPAYAEQFNTGSAKVSIDDPHGTRDLDGFVWYPTHETRTKIKHGNKVWQGIEVAQDAEISDGKFPLLILSHGMFGHAMNQAWLAKAMTEQGYIVAAINHPRTSFFADDPDDRRELWLRPRDFTRVIDDLLADENFGSHVDLDRIYAAGHSLGGMTVLQLAGAKYDALTHQSACDQNPEGLVCSILNEWDIGKTPRDIAALSQDLSDPRIRAIVSLDMGGAQVFSDQSLAALATPTLIYSASAGHVDMDKNSRLLKAKMPTNTVTYLEPTGYTHFDFMGLCTEKGLDILKKFELQDVEVCIDGRDIRATKHRDFVKTITSFFDGL